MRTKSLITQALFAKEGCAYEAIRLPHTWNNLDGQDGGADYWRGIGTYQLQLPDPTEGKRQYIEIQGANHVATVYCNGRELGTHKGGFSIKDKMDVLLGNASVMEAVGDTLNQLLVGGKIDLSIPAMVDALSMLRLTDLLSRASRTMKEINQEYKHALNDKLSQIRK